VDDSVHPADVVHLIGECPGLGCAGQVADDHSRGVRGEVAERRRPLEGAGVQDYVMALTHENPGGATAESVGGAGDEDSGHGRILLVIAGQCPGLRKLSAAGQRSFSNDHYFPWHGRVPRPPGRRRPS
jgi:hypothetical protein